jgi:N-acetylmuramic acid 6-phosphate (MurNAc-6-P) etherase
MDTEGASPRYFDLDVWAPLDIAEAMIEGQFRAVAAVRAARFALLEAALAAAERLRKAGRLVYVGAGTSGRLAVQDGAELVPTFSWPQERLLLLIAGGRNALLRSVEGAEDAVDQAARLAQQHDIGGDDVVIAVAASGTTPFTLSCLTEAKRRGALTIVSCKQSRYADPERGRSRNLAGYGRGADCRVHQDESRNGATYHPQRLLICGHDLAGARLRWPDGGPPGR